MKLRIPGIVAGFGVMIFFLTIVSVGIMLPGRGQPSSALQVNAQAVANVPSVTEVFLIDGAAPPNEKPQERRA